MGWGGEYKKRKKIKLEFLRHPFLSPLTRLVISKPVKAGLPEKMNDFKGVRHLSCLRIVSRSCCKMAEGEKIFSNSFMLPYIKICAA